MKHAASRYNQTVESLMNGDILHLIFFVYFDLQPGSCIAVQTRKDLLSAAKTCRVFLEPAVNSFWCILSSFAVLLVLLSAEIGNNYLIIMYVQTSLVRMSISKCFAM